MLLGVCDIVLVAVLLAVRLGVTVCVAVLVIVLDAVLLEVREGVPVRVNVLEDVDVMVEERVGM